MRLKQRKEKRENKSKARASKVDGRGGEEEEEEAQELWGMLYANDAGIVSRSPGGLGRTMTMIGIVCSAFGLTMSVAKTDKMRLQTKIGRRCR